MVMALNLHKKSTEINELFLNVNSGMGIIYFPHIKQKIQFEIPKRLSGTTDTWKGPKSAAADVVIHQRWED